jgi:hypothetical protein
VISVDTPSAISFTLGTKFCAGPGIPPSMMFAYALGVAEIVAEPRVSVTPTADPAKVVSVIVPMLTVTWLVTTTFVNDLACRAFQLTDGFAPVPVEVPQVPIAMESMSTTTLALIAISFAT